jgi:hypothetical protein
MRAISSFLPPPSQNGNPDRKPLYSGGAIEELSREAGLIPGIAEEIECLWDFEDEETALKGILSAGLSSIAIQTAGEQAVREAVRNAIQPFKKQNGRIQLNNSFRCLVSEA